MVQLGAWGQLSQRSTAGMRVAVRLIGVTATSPCVSIDAAQRGVAMPQVMIVEDEPITAADLDQNLTALGHEITSFDNGMDAIARAQVICPDLVLMDVPLWGELIGIDTAQRLREQREVPIAPLLCFAAHEFDTVHRLDG